MLELTSCDNRPLCHGYRWKIRDEHRLAVVVATLLLGNHAKARLILASDKSRSLSGRALAVDTAIAALKVDEGRDEIRWHRDGLLFQMISWVGAVQSVAERGTLVRAPHVRPADKGLDGLLLDPPVDDSASWRATICEDKATDHPRKTIREEVWPEFVTFESGARDNQINADAATLLSSVNLSDEDVASITDDLWRTPLHYRVAVTIDPERSAQLRTDKLFRGYDSVVSDGCERRQADAFPVDGIMRDWMDAFAARVIDVLQSHSSLSATLDDSAPAMPGPEVRNV